MRNAVPTIECHNRTGSFSNVRKYRRKGALVEIEDWTRDVGPFATLPSGTEFQTMPLAEAREDWAQRLAHGYTRTA